MGQKKIQIGKSPVEKDSKGKKTSSSGTGLLETVDLKTKAKFISSLTIVKYVIVLCVLIPGILLRTTGIVSKNTSSAFIIVSAIVLVAYSLRLLGKYSLVKEEDYLFNEVRALKTALLLFFIYCVIVMLSGWLTPVNFDTYLILADGICVIIIGYIASYFFYSRKKEE